MQNPMKIEISEGTLVTLEHLTDVEEEHPTHHQKKAFLNAPKVQEGGKYRDADFGYSVGRDFPTVNSV